MYSDVHDDTNNNTDGDADGQYDDDDISGVDGDGNMTNNKEYAYLWVTYLKGGQQLLIRCRYSDIASSWRYLRSHKTPLYQ